MGAPISPAILGRELRSIARARASYVVRAGYLLLLVGVILLCWFAATEGRTESVRELSRLGRELYVTFFATELVLVVLICPVLLCGAIADETADRTIEVLLTLPVGRTAIVASKFASRMSYVLLLLAASLPAMAVCLFFGGVGPAEVAISILMVVGIAGWVSALTLIFSALVRRAFVAALLTYAAAFGWSVGLMVVGAVSMIVGMVPMSACVLLSPPFYLAWHLAGATDQLFDPFWGLAAEMALLAGSSAAFLWGASRLLGRSLSQAAPRESAAATQSAAAPWVLGGEGFSLLFGACAIVLLLFCIAVLPLGYREGIAAGWLQFSVCLATLAYVLARGIRGWFFRGRVYRPVWEDGFLWKEVGPVGSGAARVAARTATGVVAAIGILFLFDRRTAEEVGIAVFVLEVLFGLALIVVSVAGGSSIAAEREEGMIDLLLVTPAPAWRIFDSKLWGALSQLLPLGVFFLLYGGACAAMGLFPSRVDALLGAGVLLAALYAQAVLACALSLRLRKSTSAILVAIALPLCLYAAWPTLVSLLSDRLYGDPWRLALAFQVNPFFFFGVLAASALALDSAVELWPLGLRAAALLDMFAFVCAGYAIRAAAWRGFRGWTRPAPVAGVP